MSPCRPRARNTLASSNMAPAISNRLHQILDGEAVFPFQVTCFLTSAAKILTAANLSLPSNSRAGNPASKCSLPSRAMRSSFQFIIDRFAARAATTGPIFVTVSAPCVPASATPWELFFTMQNNQLDGTTPVATTATGSVDDRRGVDSIEDFSFVPRLSKHCDFFQ